MNNDNAGSCDVLITGVSGFIAGALARALAAAGERVLGVGRTAPLDPPPPNFVFAPLNVRDFEATRDLLATARPRVVYHLAAHAVLQPAAGSEDNGPRLMLETNVAGTWNVLEAARRANVAAVVVASSDKQYGALASPPYLDDDTTAFANGGVYELSKAQQDQAARLYAGLFDTPFVRVARLTNIYGPGDTHWSRLVPGTIRRTIAGEPPRITAGPAGAALREYVFLDDALAALRALAADALARGNAPLRVPFGKLANVGVNIGSGQRFAAQAVIELIQRLLADEHGIVGPPPLVAPPPGPTVFEPGSQFVDSAKLSGILPSWAPRDLENGLRATLPWYVAHLSPQPPPLERGSESKRVR